MRIQADELAYFFMLLGKATYYVQHLENSLHHLLALTEFDGPGSVTAAEANATLEKFRRKTLGRLISTLEVEGLGLPSNRLRALNEERRWMIHQILKDEEYRLTSDASYRGAVFLRLEQFVAEAQELNKLIGDEVIRTTLAKGVSPESIDEALRRELRKM